MTHQEVFNTGNNTQLEFIGKMAFAYIESDFFLMSTQIGDFLMKFIIIQVCKKHPNNKVC